MNLIIFMGKEIPKKVIWFDEKQNSKKNILHEGRGLLNVYVYLQGGGRVKNGQNLVYVIKVWPPMNEITLLRCLEIILIQIFRISLKNLGHSFLRPKQLPQFSQKCENFVKFEVADLASIGCVPDFFQLILKICIKNDF